MDAFIAIFYDGFGNLNKEYTYDGLHFTLQAYKQLENDISSVLKWKKLLYVTGSRAEYGIMKRLLKSLKDDNDIDLSIIATGMHCDSKYGYTYKTIEKDGFIIEN